MDLPDAGQFRVGYLANGQPSTSTTANKVEDDAHRSRNLNRYPRHADVGAVEVFDSLGCIFRGLISDIANPPLGDEFDVCDLSSLA